MRPRRFLRRSLPSTTSARRRDTAIVSDRSGRCGIVLRCAVQHGENQIRSETVVEAALLEPLANRFAMNYDIYTYGSGPCRKIPDLAIKGMVESHARGAVNCRRPCRIREYNGWQWILGGVTLPGRLCNSFHLRAGPAACSERRRLFACSIHGQQNAASSVYDLAEPGYTWGKVRYTRL